MFGVDTLIKQRLKNLETHLRQENPVLLDVVPAFCELDKVAYRMGLLPADNSYAMQISWWPLVSVLGTFSAGKSSFINHYLGVPLQSTANQAVDEKFTVICHGREEQLRVLPGLALDADSRFPFYQIGTDIESLSTAEEEHINRYLQLKTCNSEVLRGKILIDSPGFDADAQRTATLRITEHIINLSDLVIVLFDARHPEPEAMQDTLEYLVERSVARPDSSKFLYVLNKIDTATREEDPEQVFAAWRRALVEKGLKTGRFYTIYNPDVALSIDDDMLQQRLRGKRDADVAEIYQRIQQVELERSYRILGALEKQAHDIEQRIVPLLSKALARWRLRTLILDVAVFGALGVLFHKLVIETGYWDNMVSSNVWQQRLGDNINLLLLVATLVLVAGFALHLRLRKLAATGVRKWLTSQAQGCEEALQLLRGFARSTVAWRSLFNEMPAGWGRRSKRQLRRVLADTDRLAQGLNDRYADPSGDSVSAAPPKRPPQ